MGIWKIRELVKAHNPISDIGQAVNQNEWKRELLLPHGRSAEHQYDIRD